MALYLGKESTYERDVSLSQQCEDEAVYIPKSECGDCGDYSEAIAELQDAVRSLDSEKQDKLVAGDNITIEGNVISAGCGCCDLGAMYHVGIVPNSSISAPETRTRPRLQLPMGTDIVSCDLDSATFGVSVPGTYTWNILIDVTAGSPSGGFIQCHLGRYDRNSGVMEDEFYAGKRMITGWQLGGVYSFAVDMEPGKDYVPTFTLYGTTNAQIDFGWIQLVYVGRGTCE